MNSAEKKRNMEFGARKKNPHFRKNSCHELKKRKLFKYLIFINNNQTNKKKKISTFFSCFNPKKG